MKHAACNIVVLESCFISYHHAIGTVMPSHHATMPLSRIVVITICISSPLSRIVMFTIRGGAMPDAIMFRP